MAIEKITKRSGAVVDFDQDKIERAIARACEATGVTVDESQIHEITTQVVEEIETKFEGATPGVEDVQDVVERRIAEAGLFDVAKAYILYRYQQKEIREEKQAEAVQAAKEHKLSVTKRDGSKVAFDVNEITDFLVQCCGDLKDEIDVDAVVKEAMSNIYDGITTKEINQAVVMALKARIERDPSYSKVAARLLFNDLYKDVIGVNEFNSDFEEQYKQGLAETIERGVKAERLDRRMLDFDFSKLQEALTSDRDNLFYYMGAQVLYDRYFLKDLKQNFLETPQYFWMRIAMGLSLEEENKEERAIEFYNTMSTLHYVPSTPTLFHSGTTHPQMSSCYLTTVEDDLSHIFKSIGDNAQLSKWSGGLGNDWTNIRATGALIKSTNVGSQGVVPFLKIADATTAAINRSGKRRGATCVYLETWHLDVEDFLELRKNTGDERRRTHDMNTANWIPDLFMKRVMEDKEWTLFSPEEVPDLHHIYGRKFEEQYENYEKMAERGEIALFKKVKAKDLWRKMITMLFETGHPWITFKDPSNIRSPQDHVGVVHSSNLCTEITLNTSKEETAVCNLGSINLFQHVQGGQINKEKLAETTKTAMRMLDNVIDLNFYPTDEARNSNLRHRPVGLGVMGLQDALYEMGMVFDTQEAVDFSDEIQEYISYHAILGSSELAKERGAYGSYRGSKWDRGLFPLDTLKMLEDERGITTDVSHKARLDWKVVYDHVKEHGMRNSNTMAIAPTATIANISGVFPSIEPIYKNVYVKSNFSGEFTTNNRYLIEDLKKLGLWSEEMLEKLKHYDGSIQPIDDIPDSLKEKYKEVFEINSIWIVKHAAHRGKWIDQSQSINVFINTTSGKVISDTYAHAWRMGLKTTYYLRSLGASAVEKSTLDVNKKFDKPQEVEAEAAPEAVAEPVVEPEPVREPVKVEAVSYQKEEVVPQKVTAPASTIFVAEDAICEACE